VVEDFNADLAPHSISVLCGPSGAGKSTLLRALCRMNDRVPGFQVSGSIRVGGQDIYGDGIDTGNLRRRAGLLFQKPCMFTGSILDNVLFGIRHHHPELKAEFEDRARTALEQSALWREVKERLHDPAASLSFGQQQRLALARVLILDPELLLLDEPTASLDPASTRLVEDLALELRKRHTLVWVTHNTHQTERLADRVIHLENVPV
jgi:phosphate transport system ATP-binding protein